MHPAPRKQHLRRSRIALADGVVAYPTEAVYGLGCRPDNAVAVARILRLKRRPASKRGLILVAASFAQLARYIDLETVPDLETVLSTWPGPVSWVFPARQGLPACLRGAGNSIAVRVSAQPVVRALCRVNGPLVSTSANPSGKAPARTARQARRYFAGRLDYVYPGALFGPARVSELRCAVSHRVLRPAAPPPAGAGDFQAG